MRQNIQKMERWSNFLVFLLFFSFAFGFLDISPAADYPAKSIQIISTYPPGGGSDFVGRLVSNRLSNLLGQPVVVINKAGGGGVIGTYAAKASPADGYTIVVLTPAHIGAPLLTKGITFDILRDFSMVNLAISSPSIIGVRNDAPWLTLDDLIGEAKNNPGKLTYSTNGYGSTAHFAAELLHMATGVELTHVPMEGAGPAITAVLGGHTNITVNEFGSLQKYLEAGSLRGLAIMAKERLKKLPNVMTCAEKGFPNLIFGTWQGFFVRSDTPRKIIEKLDKAFTAVLNEKEIIAICEKTGWVVENVGSKDSAKYLIQEQKKRSDVARSANIVPK